jgi:hypothetical protein
MFLAFVLSAVAGLAWGYLRARRRRDTRYDRNPDEILHGADHPVPLTEFSNAPGPDPGYGDAHDFGHVRIVRRRAPWSDVWADYVVLLDGHPWIVLRNGEVRDIAVVPARHRIQISVSDRWKSPLRYFEVAADETVVMRCGPNLPAILAFIRMFRANNAVRLNAGGKRQQSIGSGDLT